MPKNSALLKPSSAASMVVVVVGEARLARRDALASAGDGDAAGVVVDFSSAACHVRMFPLLEKSR